MTDEEVRENIEKNLRYQETQISKIRNKKVLFFDNKTWQAQKDKLRFLRYVAILNETIDLSSLKSEFKEIGKGICDDVGQLLIGDIKNFGKSLLFERGVIEYKDLETLRKIYLQIKQDGYIEFVRLDITRESSIYKKILRENIIINDLKCFLQFIGKIIQNLKYLGETCIFIGLNNIEGSVIYYPSSARQFSQKSSEVNWEDYKYYQSFDLIDRHQDILQHFSDGIFQNYGDDKFTTLK